MEFDRMWDIAGCRCILKGDKSVLRLLEVLNEKLTIKKVNNYYETKPESGYRSIHLYVSAEGDKNTVEIQIRNRNDHNWATLVEIIDLLYGRKIKEGENDKNLYVFHQMMSTINELDTKDKLVLLDIIHRNEIFRNLLSVFAKNYLRVRIRWLELSRRKQDHFFVISTSKDEIPEIKNFSEFVEAEAYYFDLFKSRASSNNVMTYLPQTNFQNLETAYSNYTLTTHEFINDYFKLIETSLVELLETRSLWSFFKLYMKYIDNYGFYTSSVKQEISYMKNYSDLDKTNQAKLKYWIKELRGRIKKREIDVQESQKNFNLSYPGSGAYYLLFRIIMIPIERRLNKLDSQQ